MKSIPRRVWLEIDLGLLQSNYRCLADTVAPAEVMAVLKANAYGLGVLPIATALSAAGVTRFGVAEPFEALQLLELSVTVQLLSALLPGEIEPMLAGGVVLPVTDLATARSVSQAARRMKLKARVHLKLDSGMGRMGILTDAGALETIRAIKALEALELEGIFSHFPEAYESTSQLTIRQMDTFERLLRELAAEGITFARRHIANSDAISNFPRACQPPYNLVRVGLNLHGFSDTRLNPTIALKPTITLKSRLSAIRELPAGSTIGYGRSYRLHRRTRIGTIAAGYADGLPLALSNRGYLLVRGVPCPVLGRVSMDYTTVSLEGVPQAEIGEEVVCLGSMGAETLSVADWALLKNTHPYEIICSFGSRVERRYKPPS